MLAGTVALVAGLGGLATAPASAAALDATVSLTGASGTVSVGNTLYAKSGGQLTLTITTTENTKCVSGVPAYLAGSRDSKDGQNSWTFTGPAPAGTDGVIAFSVAPATGNSGGGNDKCNGSSVTRSASFTLDNTGPAAAAAITPAANAAGWNKTDATVTWTAVDTGVGVTESQPFRTDTVSTDGIVTKSATAPADRLGNLGTGGSVTVRVDKTAPTITAQQTSGGWGTPTTVTFTCLDETSGIESCLADGSSSNAKTISGDGTVTGTATDKAGNTQTLNVEVKNVDTTPPTLTGAPTTSPNGKGWYNSNVTVRWTAADAESGIPTQPADTTISGEGRGLTSSTSVTNGAGLATTSSSAPPVNIDKTAPTTGISGGSNDWTNGNVTLTLKASDNSSGVDFSTYSVDGNASQNGSIITLADEGTHTVEYFSTDNAGNAEAPRQVTVKIDKTVPTISHHFDPAGYTDGTWTNQPVTVLFDCGDAGGSKLASCGPDATVTDEGANQQVKGTARDNAGNTATDTASVNLDTTAPVVSATVDREANEHGWYNDDVTVTFAAEDKLSGVSEVSGTKVLEEGAGQSATGTATDAAGNKGSASVSGINIDKTKPLLTGSFSPGWHTGDVTVTWTCTDSGSGVLAQPKDTVVEGEGTNLAATASCADKAGNTTSTTVDGIKIDRHAPTTTGSAEGKHQNGWYGEPVSVTLSGSDNLSKVVKTYYSVDGGAIEQYDGPFTIDAEGTHSVSFWSEDVAGNLEKAGAPLELKIDTTAPVTTVTNPLVPNSGWFVVSGIPFSFSAEDGADRSGVASTYFTIDGVQHDYTEPYTQDLSTGSHDVTFWSVDAAGNVEEAHSFLVEVDTVAPTIAGAQSPAKNKYGWNNSDVDVTFTCDDVGSGLQTGVAGCAGDTSLRNDGAGQMVTGNAVDVAGNKSSTTYGPVNIDTVKPTLVGVPSDPNGAGWYKTDVTVTWVGDDALSGIDPATQPEDGIIVGEGSNLGAGPATIDDKAGNSSAPASISGIKIDRKAPVITGAATAQPNEAGWYNRGVTVDFKCTDPKLADGTNGSGVAMCPTSMALSADGANQSVTSGLATDFAGNTSEGKMVSGINIDSTAPSTTSDNTCTQENGWCKGDTADVILRATDQAGLSGVKEIHYVVDEGEEQVASGASTTVSVPLSGTGAGTVRYWAVDNAGNAEKSNGVALKWDNIAPTVSHTLTPAPNANGWNNADVTVTFAAKDDDKGSGVASVSEPVTVSQETAGLGVNGSAKDTAGNVGTDSVTVKLDKTKPTIEAAITAGERGDNGWYVGPVTVTFTCADTLSRVATCPDPMMLAENGSNEATGTVTDKAGNTASTSLGGIKIDQEKPTLTAATVNVAGQQYVLGTPPKATCTASDGVSGLASCAVTVTGGNTNGVGTFNWTAIARDNAGNTTTITGTYTVVYRWDGFLQPINDTAHQVGASTSIFKAGSTVPVKFQLKKADGTIVQSAMAPTWLNPVKGSAMSAPVDETAYTATADSGSAYRWDSTAQQYIYNWKTDAKSAGSYWRIGVKFDDGQVYYVNIGLR